jgi:penicillin-binding protein 2
MFERRLKILLMFLSLVVAALVVRTAQVQLFNRKYWKGEAVKAMERTGWIETSRGRILDYQKRTLAEDEPCTDACVDYRALTVEPDEAWVRKQAIARLRAQLGGRYDAAGTSRAEQRQMVREEMPQVRGDIEKMWVKLAEVSGQSLDDIDAIRAGIADKVEHQRRYAWVQNFDRSKTTQTKAGAAAQEKPAWERLFLSGESTEADADMDRFKVDVAEQFEPHVILPAIDTEVQNELGKNIDRYPGLVLRPGTHRFYPYHEVAAHLIGGLGRVDDSEQARMDQKDELRRYLPNDLIGKNGVEALCEPTLRGARGQVEKTVGAERLLSNMAADEHVLSTAEPGGDVRLSIDIELQKRIQNAFAHAQILDPSGRIVESDALLHGAAVVIDIPTGQVRAMVSYPTYDANDFEEQYHALVNDNLNHPLMNRATMSRVEPGSTVKPIVGIGAITSGVQKVTDTIECTGYLILDGIRYGRMGRCWVASKYFEKLGGKVAHHPIPQGAEHPSGNLTFSDGLERSCNVFFETTADRLGIERLSEWFFRFGLGRKTGVGIAEAPGKLPTGYHIPATQLRSGGWFAGIGEGFIAATPIQMANVAATIARRGIWMRPTLLAAKGTSESPNTLSGAVPDGPDRVDLHLDPEAIEAAQEGMFRVVNSKAGTGTALVLLDDMLKDGTICGKTGTAQTSPLTVPMLDSTGKPLLDENKKPRMQLLTPSTVQNPNPLTPWYRGSGASGTDITHAWYIGFAPREHPQIAFAVLVEYGGSGGGAGASVARPLLHACIDLHYLTLPGVHPAPSTQPTASADANGQ